MAKSPLRLEHYFFTTVQVTANKKFFDQKERPPVTPKIAVSVGKDEKDPNGFGVMLKVVIASSDHDIQPYEVELEGIGVVTIEKDVPKADQERLALVNGASILYGAFRETILTLTRRGPWPAVMLPPHSFAGYGPASESKRSAETLPKRRITIKKKGDTSRKAKQVD